MAKKAKNILIADDDPIYREIAAEALAAAGHTVTVAQDGGAANQLLATRPFECAIIDLTMPVANGINVIETLRRGGPNATTPVVVVTGLDEASDIERAYEAGATSFLTKPLNWMLFTPHVEFVLRCGETEAELREASATSAFLSELKSHMMSALAQEFQAPLKTILNFSQLIDKEVYGAVTPPAYKEMMADIERSARMLNAALLKVMDFGRSLTEHLHINAEPVNARNAVLEAVAAFETQAMRRDITIRLDIQIPADAMLHADRALFNQAMRSILDNAIRLSPRGGDVHIEAAPGPDGGISIKVRDDGPHLAEALLHDVNGRPAKQGRQAVPAQSSDVSIRIAKILTEAHNGEMKITNGAASGNVVHLTMPLANKPAQRPIQEPPSASDALQRLARISAELTADPRFKDRPALLAAGGRSDGGALKKVGQFS